jgi:hypothetical protein
MIDTIIDCIRHVGDDALKPGFLLCVPPLMRSVDRWDDIVERDHIALVAATPKRACLLTADRWPTSRHNAFYPAQLDPESGDAATTFVAAIESRNGDLVLGGVAALGRTTLKSYARNAKRIGRAGKVPLLIVLASDTGTMLMTLFTTVALPRRTVH